MGVRLLWRWYRYGRRQLLPWRQLAVASWRWLVTQGAGRDRAASRWMAALVRIDSVKVTAFLNDLLW